MNVQATVSHRRIISRQRTLDGVQCSAFYPVDIGGGELAHVSVEVTYYNPDHSAEGRRATHGNALALASAGYALLRTAMVTMNITDEEFEEKVHTNLT